MTKAELQIALNDSEERVATLLEALDNQECSHKKRVELMQEQEDEGVRSLHSVMDAQLKAHNKALVKTRSRLKQCKNRMSNIVALVEVLQDDGFYTRRCKLLYRTIHNLASGS